MGFIRTGFTGGFLGIVISIADIFINSRILEKLSSVGLYLADFFGKACINTLVNECTIFENFTTILATIVGNCIAYFVIFALISMGISVIKMWLTSEKKEEPEAQQPAQQIVLQQPESAPQQTIQAEAKPEQKEKKQIKKQRARKPKK